MNIFQLILTAAAVAAGCVALLHLVFWLVTGSFT